MANCKINQHIVNKMNQLKLKISTNKNKTFFRYFMLKYCIFYSDVTFIIEARFLTKKKNLSGRTDTGNNGETYFLLEK